MALEFTRYENSVAVVTLLMFKREQASDRLNLNGISEDLFSSDFPLTDLDKLSIVEDNLPLYFPLDIIIDKCIGQLLSDFQLINHVFWKITSFCHTFLQITSFRYFN